MSHTSNNVKPFWWPWFDYSLVNCGTDRLMVFFLFLVSFCNSNLLANEIKYSVQDNQQPDDKVGLYDSYRFKDIDLLVKSNQAPFLVRQDFLGLGLL